MIDQFFVGFLCTLCVLIGLLFGFFAGFSKGLQACAIMLRNQGFSADPKRLDDSIRAIGDDAQQANKLIKDLREGAENIGCGTSSTHPRELLRAVFGWLMTYKARAHGLEKNEDSSGQPEP